MAQPHAGGGHPLMNPLFSHRSHLKTRHRDVVDHRGHVREVAVEQEGIAQDARRWRWPVPGQG